MLKLYHYGILATVLLTFFSITSAEMYDRYKLYGDGDPIVIDDTFCDRNCGTIGPSDYRCDGGLIWCICSATDDHVVTHQKTNCSFGNSPDVYIQEAPGRPDPLFQQDYHLIARII